MEFKFLSTKELENLDVKAKLEYYNRLREYADCKIKTNIHSKDITRKLIAKLSPMLRNYDFDIIGEENVPREPGAVFICNHSNSHDFFTAQEAFGELGRPETTMCASDCLDFFTLQLFKAGNATIIDRASKTSSLNGMLEFSEKIRDGQDGVIFGETTWNLHPIKPMLPIKAGGTQSALIANTVVVPTVFEYVEVPDVVSKEKELYTRCIVYFGKPITVKVEDNIFEKTLEIQKVLENMRLELWRKLDIRKTSIEEINQDVYLNHTYLKKFDAFGFEYDSEHEFKFLLKDKNGQPDNEYHLDEAGNFVPGITHKKR